MLNYIILVLSALATGGVYFVRSELSHWWILPILLGFFFALTVCYLLGIWIASLFLSKKDPVKKPSYACRWMIWFTMDWLMKLLRIRIDLKGEEMLPQEPCVLVSNHLSDFDPMTVLAVLKQRKPLYISKEGNFRIPIVGRFIHRAGFLSIDRENAMRSMRTLKRAAEMMKAEQVDMGIYPEGTRSKTGELLEFKAGAFFLAKKADAPIVIMTTRGTEQIMRRIPFRSTRVFLELHEVLNREQVSEMSVDEISAYARSVIEAHLQKNG